MDKESKIVTSQPVCVTGAAGFVAAHLIKQLLESGYKVRGTVRKVDKEKYKFLYDLDKDGGNLELVAANLIDEGSFDDAVKGCEYVMHVASPYVMNAKDPQKELVEPALKGTITVLESCTKSKTVKRVILTSSVAAITDSPISDHVYTEKDWNMQSTLARLPYYYSKRIAEEAGWDYVKKHSEDKEGKFELVVINPFVIIGPELTVPKEEDLNTSNKIIADIFNGIFPGILSLNWGLVDVRDVARAHVLAMENSKAEGRYLCCAGVWPMKDVVTLVNKRYNGGGEYSIPHVDLSCAAGNVVVRVGSYFEKKDTGVYLREHLGKTLKIDNSKIVKNLGLEFRKLEDTFVDLCDWMVAHKFVHNKKHKK